jgi:hypothetical protein
MLVFTIPVGGTAYKIVDGGTYNNSLWLVTSGGYVTKFDKTSSNFVANINIGGDTRSIIYEPTIGVLWVARYDNNTIYTISATSNSIVRQITVGTGPIDLVLDNSDAVADNHSIIVSNLHSNNLTKLNAYDGSVKGTYSIPRGAPYSLAIDKLNKILWIGQLVNGNNLSKFSLQSNSIVTDFLVDGFPTSILYDVNDHVWTLNQQGSASSNKVSKVYAGNPAANAIDIIMPSSPNNHIVVNNNTGSITIPVNVDSVIEGNELLVFELLDSGGNVVTTSQPILLIDNISPAPAPGPTPAPTPAPAPGPTPTYQLAASSAWVDEGYYAYVTLFTTNVAVGTVINYNVFNLQPSDYAANFNSFTVQAPNSSGVSSSTISFLINSDSLTEGVEYMRLNLVGITTNPSYVEIQVNDTSQAPAPAPTPAPTPAPGPSPITFTLEYTDLNYQVLPDNATVNEGDTVYVRLTVNNVPFYPYTVPWIEVSRSVDGSDYTISTTVANFVINSGASSVYSIYVRPDSVVEQEEYDTIAVTQPNGVQVTRTIRVRANNT